MKLVCTVLATLLLATASQAANPTVVTTTTTNRALAISATGKTVIEGASAAAIRSALNITNATGLEATAADLTTVSNSVTTLQTQLPGYATNLGALTTNLTAYGLTINTGSTNNALTASRAMVTDANKGIASSAVTSTELGYVAGVTSALQTQLDAKATSTNTALLNGTNVLTGTNSFTGTVIITNAASTISGNGAGLTNLAAGNIASGSLSDARLSANVPLLNAVNSFSGATNLFSGVVNASSSLGHLRTLSLGDSANAGGGARLIISQTTANIGYGAIAFSETTSGNNAYAQWANANDFEFYYNNSGGYFSLKGCNIRAVGTDSSLVTFATKAAASQSAAIQEWQNSSGTALLKVDAKGVIVLPTNTAAPSTITGSGQIYSLQTAGTAEIFVKDGAGNATQISPHARGSLPAEGKSIDDGKHSFPIIIHHQNVYAGEEEWVNITALAAAVEKLTGQRFAYKRKLADGLKADWEADQDRQQAAHFAERQRELAVLSRWQASENKGTNAPAVRGPFVRMAKPEHIR